MSTLPIHVQLNRAAWQEGLSRDHYAPGRRAWSVSDISWGIWSTPESALSALGNLSSLEGQSVIELGCGTAYFSSWLARRGARPVGVDITPAQLASAREFQNEFGIKFPLVKASAESVPLKGSTFDLAISEYGASTWCDPLVWIPEAARLLRPGGRLVFLCSSTLLTLCTPEEDGLPEPLLVRGQRGLHRVDWPGQVEFSLPHGEMIAVLGRYGFEIERLVEVYPPEGAGDSPWKHVSLDWSRRWPCEEIWCSRLNRRAA